MILARLAGDTIEENYIWNYVTRKRETAYNFHSCQKARMKLHDKTRNNICICDC